MALKINRYFLPRPPKWAGKKHARSVPRLQPSPQTSFNTKVSVQLVSWMQQTIAWGVSCWLLKTWSAIEPRSTKPSAEGWRHPSPSTRSAQRQDTGLYKFCMRRFRKRASSSRSISLSKQVNFSKRMDQPGGITSCLLMLMNIAPITWCLCVALRNFGLTLLTHTHTCFQYQAGMLSTTLNVLASTVLNTSIALFQ